MLSTSLETQVQELQDISDEMTSVVQNLINVANTQGVMSREPEFGKQLQASMQRILALSRASSSDERDTSHSDDITKPETHVRGHCARSRKLQVLNLSALAIFSVDHFLQTEQASAPSSNANVTSPWGGYIISNDTEDCVQEKQMSLRPRKSNHHQNAHVIGRATEDNANFSYEVFNMQHYNFHKPGIDELSRDIHFQFQMPQSQAHQYLEFSFARRIFRKTCKEGLDLIAHKSHHRQRYQRVFGNSLLYQAPQSIANALKEHLVQSENEVEQWDARFASARRTRTFIEPMSNTYKSSLNCVADSEAQFLSALDVEMYLRQRGLDLSSNTDNVSFNLDNEFAPLSTRRALTPWNPLTIAGTENNLGQSDFDKRMMNKGFPFTTWSETSSSRSGSDSCAPFSGSNVCGVYNPGTDPGGRRTVTINLQVLLGGKFKNNFIFDAADHRSYHRMCCLHGSCTRLPADCY